LTNNSSDDEAARLGHCVTGDTGLPILRQGYGWQAIADFKFQITPIVNVKTGDEVLSLNEKTGKLEPHRINALLDMGVKPVFKLTTASGRSIKTTANHPYLVQITPLRNTNIAQGSGLRVQQGSSELSALSSERSCWLKVSEIHVGQKIAVPQRNFLINSAGVSMGMPRKGLRQSRSLSPVTMQLALASSAAQSRYSSIGSLQATE
jgi:hypothetical protein